MNTVPRFIVYLNIDCVNYFIQLHHQILLFEKKSVAKKRLSSEKIYDMSALKDTETCKYESNKIKLPSSYKENLLPTDTMQRQKQVRENLL